MAIRPWHAECAFERARATCPRERGAARHLVADGNLERPQPLFAVSHSRLPVASRLVCVDLPLTRTLP